MDDSFLDIVKTGRRRSDEPHRVILVSNRLPLTRTGPTGSRPSCGGLASGLKQVARRWPAKRMAGRLC